MVNTKKASLLQKITDSLRESSNFALVKFEKTKHTTLEQLRKDLKKNNANLSIVKNTIFEKALNKLSSDKKGLSELKKQAFPLKENSALLTLREDWSQGLKAIFNFMKKDETMSFKIGYIDDTVYGTSDLQKIAQLPGKDQLIAKIIGSMKSPMARTTRALSFNIQKFVYILSEKAKQSV